MWATCTCKPPTWRWLAALACLATLPATGCVHWRDYYFGSASLPLASPPQPLGASVESWFDSHQEAGESQDFVIYDHEFHDDSARLTPDGEDHLRQIAARARNTSFPIVVEQSKTTPRPQRDYPVHVNPELDLQRLQTVVRALTMMGVPNAQTRVVLSPALAPGYTSYEGERALNSGMNGGRLGGFGGGGGGGGFGGGLGGLGGGGFGGGGFF